MVNQNEEKWEGKENNREESCLSNGMILFSSQALLNVKKKKKTWKDD